MILPPLLPALLLLAQAGHGRDMVPTAPGRAATSVKLPDTAPSATLQAFAPVAQMPATAEPEAPTVAESLSSAPVPSDLTIINRSTARQRNRHAPGDPLEGFNRKMFAIQDGLDRAIIRPAALGYRHVVPKPVRGGLRHFLSNLTEPIVFLNYLLQLKPGRAAETLARFTVNSTIGVGGMLDVAKLPSIGLPHRPNGFGNTLGFYGVRPGPYLFLPLVGPTDLRDLLGGQADSLTIPVLAAGKPFNQAAYLIPSIVIGGLDQREQNDDELRALYAGAVDPYASLRSVYLQDRKAEIDALHHRPNQDSNGSLLDESLDDPGRKVDLSEPVIKNAPPSGMTEPAPGPLELQDPLIDPGVSPKS